MMGNGARARAQWVIVCVGGIGEIPPPPSRRFPAAGALLRLPPRAFAVSVKRLPPAALLPPPTHALVPGVSSSPHHGVRPQGAV